jgi:hypothetical protein
MKNRTPEFPDSLLTLLVPAALEEAIVDHLLEHPQWAAQFWVARVDGHGGVLQSGVEQVRRRSQRLMLQFPTRHSDGLALIESLCDALPNVELNYWIVPVHASGSFHSERGALSDRVTALPDGDRQPD